MPDRMQDLIDLTSALVAIDSVNPDLVPGGAGERRIARYVANYMESIGLTVSVDEVVPDRPNVIGILPGIGGGRSLMLNAHLDTVGVTGMERAFIPQVVEGRLYGRGAYDMKASLAAILLAVKAAAEQPLRGDVIVTAVCDEEYGSIGTRAIARKLRADAALITEPTELQTCIAHRGFVWLRVTVFGHAAHGSRPDLGIDAIVKMGKFLTALERHGYDLLANPSHRLLDSGSIHASLIRGGQELSSYPDYCEVDLERRTVPGETSASVVDQIEDLLAALQERDADFTARVELLFEGRAFEIAPDEPIVQTVQRHAGDVLGQPPALIGAPFWMDSALLDEAGIPTVIFGPIGAGAHANEEWVDLASVMHCMAIYERVIRDFCG